MTKNLLKIAQMLDLAACQVEAVNQLSSSGDTISLEQAYEIQKLLIKERCLRGEKVIGIKMGFTSREKMLQMGVNDLIWGQLTDAMQITEGGQIELPGYVHPRIEPELAFLLKRPLAGEVTLSDAMQAVEAVAPAMEIIDSRYKNFQFSLEDVVADNASSSGFVLGAWQPVCTNMDNLDMALTINGKLQASGSSAAILGNPYQSLCHAARLSEAASITLKEGWIVLAGAATAAFALAAGMHVKAEVEKLGQVTCSVADDRHD